MLNSDGAPTDYTRIVTIAWDRGLLSKQSVALNAGLNVLIGGGVGRANRLSLRAFASLLVWSRKGKTLR